MLTEHYKSECPYSNEMITRARERNLDNLIMHIKLMTHTCYRRGSLNFVGSISRNLFVTLDDDDLELMNKNIDKPFDENNNLKTNITYKTNLKTIALPLTDSLEEILTKIENAPKIINNV